MFRLIVVCIVIVINNKDVVHITSLGVLLHPLLKGGGGEILNIVFYKVVFNTPGLGVLKTKQQNAASLSLPFAILSGTTDDYILTYL